MLKGYVGIGTDVSEPDPPEFNRHSRRRRAWVSSPGALTKKGIGNYGMPGVGPFLGFDIIPMGIGT